MATSRSFGGTLLTIRSPMRISPPVMFSSPAIIRSSVDLPQPEGPTSTTNSPSRIEMSTPWITAVAPKAFRTSRIATEAIHSSRSYCGGFVPSFLRFGAIRADARVRTPAQGKSSGFRQSKSKPDLRLVGTQPIALGESGQLQRQPAVDEVGLAGDVARFVRRQENRERSHFLGSTEACHRLARHEVLPHLFKRFAGRLRHGFYAFLEGRRYDRAGADRVAPDSPRNEVGGNRFGQTNYGCLGGPISIAVRQAFDGRNARRHVDDRAAAVLQHGGEERLDDAVHGFHVEVEGKIPILLRAFEHRALVHIARYIGDHVGCAEFLDNCLGEGIDRFGRQDIKLRTFRGF